MAARGVAARDGGLPRAVWVVDPGAKTVTVYGEGGQRVLTAADSLAGGDLLPGFDVPIAELFAVE